MTSFKKDWQTVDNIPIDGRLIKLRSVNGLEDIGRYKAYDGERAIFMTNQSQYKMRATCQNLKCSSLAAIFWRDLNAAEVESLRDFPRRLKKARDFYNKNSR